MKNGKRLFELSLILVLIVTVVRLTYQSDSLEITGTWKGNYQEQTIQMTFDEDSTFQAYFAAESISGHYTVERGGSEIHEIDLDFREGEERRRVETIFKLQDGNLFLMNNNPSMPRPSRFEREETLEFVKVEDEG